MRCGWCAPSGCGGSGRVARRRRRSTISSRGDVRHHPGRTARLYFLLRAHLSAGALRQSDAMAEDLGRAGCPSMAGGSGSSRRSSFRALLLGDMAWLGDLAASVVPIGFHRAHANFVNGELWGKVTDVPWARWLSEPTAAAPSQPNPRGAAGGRRAVRHPAPDGLWAARLRLAGATVAAFLFFMAFPHHRRGLPRQRPADRRRRDPMGQRRAPLDVAGRGVFAWWAATHRPWPA